MLRILSDVDCSTVASDLRPSASFSAPINPQSMTANTPWNFPGLWSRSWPNLLRLVTNRKVGQAPGRWQLCAGLAICALALMQTACVTVNLPPGPGALEEHRLSGTGKDKVVVMDISGVITSDNKEGFYTSPGMLATVKEE